MSKFIPQYDFSVVLFAQSLGWDHNSLLVGDLPTHEAVIENIQQRLGIDYDSAVQIYRQEIAEEIESFLTLKLGAREPADE